MTRLHVYLLALAAFTASTLMIIASIFQPRWISYHVTSQAGGSFDVHIGLHERCFSTHDPPCAPYPPADLCEGNGGRYFCSMWKTAGFLASFSAILCLATLVCFLIIIMGGKYKREIGWPLVSGMLTVVAMTEFVVISAVAFLFDHDDQFAIPDWSLDVSWAISLASAVTTLAAAVGLTASAYLLEPEEGYDYLEDPLDDPFPEYVG
ncbi:hypothetical protein E4U57_006904 [Claviceps arundinis]|uniref:Pre-mRNA splicing factor n=1 Tax=Claviceps arundinis TaxID=1623583 RepID=A0A9P7MUF4_9HYPO|nr:hypothetical protein E4U57_006904 [Claviceps arundinis]KAG5970596.1 hypothetical protein E4U56_007534 [Claviceps arundinis]